jgi:hypothetical protein
MFLTNDTYYQVPATYNLTIPSKTGYAKLLITSSNLNNWNYTTLNYPVIGVNSLNCSTGCAEGIRFTFKDEVSLADVTGHLTASITHDGGTYRLSAPDERLNQTFNMFPYYGVLNYSEVYLTYGGVNGAVTYSTRDYYLTDSAINNVSDSVTLYQLEYMAYVTFTIVSAYNNPITDATVQALKYYNDEDAYILVTSSLTDDYGHAVLQLDLGEWYRIIITTDSGTYVKKVYITSTALTIQLNPLTIDDYLNHTYGEVSTSFYYDNSTNVTYLYVLDNSGLVNNASFIVKDISLRNNLGTICNFSNYTAGSFYLICDLGADSIDRTYSVYAVATFTDGFSYTIYSGYFSTSSTTSSYAGNGLIATFFIIILLAFGGAMLGGHAVLLLPLIGLIVSKFAGLITIGWSSIAFFGLIAGVFFFVLRRGD